MRILTKHCLLPLLMAMLIALCTLLPPAAQAATTGATYFGGTIRTMDTTTGASATVEVVRAEDSTGKIIYAGTRAGAPIFTFDATVNKQVDLLGKTMLPGFVEAHGNFPNTYGLVLSERPDTSAHIVIDAERELPATSNLFKAIQDLVNGRLGTTTANKFVSIINFNQAKHTGNKLERNSINSGRFINSTTRQTSVEVIYASGNKKLVNDLILAEIINEANTPTIVAATNPAYKKRDGTAVPVFKTGTGTTAPFANSKEYAGIELADIAITALPVTPITATNLSGFLIGRQAMNLVKPSTAFSTLEAAEMVERGMQRTTSEGITTTSMPATVLNATGTYNPGMTAIGQDMVRNVGYNSRVVAHPLTIAALTHINATTTGNRANHTFLSWTGNAVGATYFVGSNLAPLAGATTDMFLHGTWEQYFDGAILDITGYVTRYVALGQTKVNSMPIYTGTLQWNPAQADQKVATPASFQGVIPTFNIDGVGADDDLKDALTVSFSPYNGQGQAVATYTSGNEATRMVAVVLDGIATAAAIPTTPIRHGLIGFEMADTNAKAFLDEVDKDKIIPVLSFAIDALLQGTDYGTVLGSKEANKRVPLQYARDTGGRATLYQSPNSTLSPLSRVRFATISPTSPITALEAIQAVTTNAAFANNVDDRIGSIKVNSHADFVIVERDPLAIPTNAISGIRVVTTIVANEIVYGFLPEGPIFVSTPKLPAGTGTNLESTAFTTAPAAYVTAVNTDDLPASANGHYVFGGYEFESVAGEKYFQMAFLGAAGTPLDAMKLYRVVTPGTPTATTTLTLKENTTLANNEYWISNFSNPNVALTKTFDAGFPIGVVPTSFAANAMYLITFRLDDANTGAPVILTGPTRPTNTDIFDDGSSSEAPDNTGSCTVGTSPAYDLVFLLFALGSIVALRVMRTKVNQKTKKA